MPTVHAFDYLEAPEKHRPGAVCVLFGDELFLRRLAQAELRDSILGQDHDDVPYATFDGDTVEWRDVLDELSTVSLFGGGGPRLAVIDDADDFVSLHRETLEKYVERPRKSGALLLVVRAWPGNTRLYKMVDKSGLQIECKTPTVGKGKNVDESRIAKWLVAWGASQHDVKLSPQAAATMLQLVGVELGLLDQELAKLALYAGPGGKATPELVSDVVGGWRMKTSFDLVDAVAEGNAAEALAQLERLMQSGEQAQALYGPIAWSLRRYAAATRIIERAERRRERKPLQQALKEAGFKEWPKGALADAERRLKQIGRERAGRLYRWLLDVDLKLKGSHSQQDRGRLALELLLVRLAKQANPRVASARR
jgi:DNA polymerase-3 subunit delta